jgi:flavin-dependent dehydrogenase
MGTCDYDVIVIGGGPGGAAAAKAAVDGGLKTLLVEKKKLPRHKPCDGMIMPVAESHIEKYFGALPENVKAEPHAWKGTHFHLRGGRIFTVSLPAKNVWRDKLDHWLCSESGAEIWDEARLLDFAEWKDRVEVVCQREGEGIKLSCPVMIAADGGISGIVKKIDPTFHREPPWLLYCGQDYHRGEIELDPTYFHVFLEPGMGLQPEVFCKDDLLVTDTIVFAGEKVKPVREIYHAWLADKHGFKPGEHVMSLGCRITASSTLNRFCPGTDRVLVVGEAAGFLNYGSEGISSAIATGYLAGQAAGVAAQHPPGPSYRESVEPERERTAEQWYMPALMTGKVVPELKEALMAAPPLLRLRAMNDTAAWLKRMGFKPRYIIEAIVRRLVHGGFDFRA